MSITCIIVDDEAPAREELVYLLRNLEWVRIVGQSGDAATALNLILAVQPQVVLLDIHMPGLSGIELSKELSRMKSEPVIIFTTAYENYALQAFDVNALDFILKPYHETRVLQALNKAKAFLESKDRRPSFTPKLGVRKEGKLYLLPYKDIAVAYTDEKGVMVASQANLYRVEMSLNELEVRLPSETFFRCHRGFLINLEKVREIENWFSGGYLIRVDGYGPQVMVSRKQAKEFRERLSF
jgi:DNA-binding LytR/AlgR family response regulator